MLFHTHLHPLTEQIQLDDCATAVGGVHKGLQLGAGADQILIGILLVLQTAHESAAGAGDLGGVQAEILGLGHLDGYGLEIVQKAGAAEGSAADAQTTHHLGLITNTDLAQLDTGVEHAGQLFHQFTEVHPLIGSEEKQDLAAVKGVLGGDQLHVQLVLLNLFHAQIEGPLFLAAVLLHHFFVMGGGQTQNIAQGRHHILGGNGVIAAGADAKFRTPGGVDDHMVTLFAGKTVGIKVVYFLPRAELNVHHLNGFRGIGIAFFHGSLLYRKAQAKWPQMAATDTLP